MTPEERIQAYNTAFPPVLLTFNGRIYGVWVLGNNYSNKSDLYGEFPNSVKKRILALFPDRKNLMHLFSGTVADANTVTYDISPKYKPTICDDVKNIASHKQALKDRDLVIADPPYDNADFEKYGVKPFSKAQVMRDLAEVLEKGAIVAWLDTKKPMYKKEVWFLLGEIMVSVSTNHRYRGLCLFEKL